VNHRLRYQPIVVDTEFFAKTNPLDPTELLDARIARENKLQMPFHDTGLADTTCGRRGWWQGAAAA
jgi:hypothetical protein